MDTDPENDDLIIPTSGPPVAKGHGPLFSGECEVCTHDQRAGIEELYLGFRSLALISEVANVGEQSIKTHALAIGLDKQRADNTEDMARYALNSAFDRGVLDTLDGDQTLRLIAHADKRMGKVKERQDSRPPQVVIVGVPMVGRPQEGEVKQIKGTVVITDGSGPKALPFPSRKE